MAAFLNRLIIGETPSGDDWELLVPLDYISDAGIIYSVPAGFLTDFASIPWGLWNLLPKTGKHNKAAVLHDYFCDSAAGKTQFKITRAEGDRLFLEAMEACGVGPTKRNVMFSGVRVYATVTGKK